MNSLCCVSKSPKRLFKVTRCRDHLSSGEKRAGCADFVTSPCRTFFSVYVRRPSGPRVYIRCMVGGGGGGLVWVAGGWWCGGLGRGSWICDVVVRVGFGGVVRDGRVRSSLSFELAILPILFFCLSRDKESYEKEIRCQQLSSCPGRWQWVLIQLTNHIA